MDLADQVADATLLPRSQALQFFNGALRSVNIRTGLVAEQQLAVLRAGVDVGNGRPALSVAPVVGEGEGTPEGTLHGRGVLPEQGVKQGIAGDQAAEGWEGVSAMTECFLILQDILVFLVDHDATIAGPLLIHHEEFISVGSDAATLRTKSGPFDNDRHANSGLKPGTFPFLRKVTGSLFESGRQMKKTTHQRHAKKGLVPSHIHSVWLLGRGVRRSIAAGYMASYIRAFPELDTYKLILSLTTPLIQPV